MELGSLAETLIARHRRRRGYAPLPWGIDLLLTDGCNLRCSYCPIWGEDASVPSPANFMDLDAALRFLDEVAAFRPMIRLFGSEPFRRHDKVDCTTMESYAFVDPRGRLYPCLTLDMGNVFESSFAEV